MKEEPREKKSQKRDDSQDIFEIIDLIDGKTPKASVKHKKESPSTLTPTTQIRDLSNLISVKRAYDYVGGEIHFKVAVQNVSEAVITDVNVTLVPTAQYEISERVKVVKVLKPNESRGLDFNLIPITCGKSKIFGSCYFMDALSNPYTITIPPKEIWIKCPLVEPKKTTLSEVEAQKRGLQKGTAKIPFTINEHSAFDILIDQISALDLSEVITGNFKGIFSGVAKITSDVMIIESEIKSNTVVLTVWTKDLKQATGFLAYLKNLVDMAFHNASKIEGRTETICQKILNSSDVIQRFITLFNYCEESWTIGESLTLIKEIETKIEKRNPGSSIVEKLQGWVGRFEGLTQEEAIIPENIGIKLQFQIIDWISELNRAAWDNLETYESTFPEQKYQIQQLYKIIKENNPSIIDLEKKYTNKILQLLMLIDKESGLCLYQYDFTKSVVISNLVGGFLTAIQDLGVEIAENATEMKKLAYKNFEIVIEEKEKVRAAIFLKGSPTEEIIKRFHLFLSEFQQKFKNELESWEGEINMFDSANELVKKVFV